MLVLYTVRRSYISATLISFDKQPTIGFAHRIYQAEHCQIQKELQRSIVLVYVKSGHLTAHIYDKSFSACAGSLLVLSYQFPFCLESTYGQYQDYCSIQLYADYDFNMLNEHDDFPRDFSGLALSVVTPPCPEVESIKKDMLSIISQMSISREKHGFCAPLAACGILSKLDIIYRNKLHHGQSASYYWEYKIKQYIADHIRQQISLQDLATAFGRTPNYLNGVFKQAAGGSIHQYLCRAKIHLAAALMETNSMTFPVACENVGIADVSHGYRLFRRYMGITPAEYMRAEHCWNK